MPAMPYERFHFVFHLLFRNSLLSNTTRMKIRGSVVSCKALFFPIRLDPPEDKKKKKNVEHLLV